MERYLTGLLTDLPHKTCDTIANVVAGTSIERLQHLLTDAAWDPLALDEARVKRLLALHPVTDGILVFDDTGLPKKGIASVGVAAQYSGTLGKIGKCQVVVSRGVSGRRCGQQHPVSFPHQRPTVFPRVLDPRCRATQAGAGARGTQPANQTRDRPGLARSRAAMGRAHSGRRCRCSLRR